MQASLRPSRQPSGSHTLPEGNDDENREVSLDKATNESSSSFPECNEKKPIFHNFMGLQESDDQADQVGEADEGLGQITKSQHGSEEISLELKVGCASYTTKKRKAKENLLACRIRRMKLSCREVRREEMRCGVSLELKLGVDPWVIKKTIETSDLGHLSRLLFARDGVKKHILLLWDANRIESLHEGVQVCVWDCDTKSEHQLVFKRWASNGSYVLIGKWKKEFVERRVLNKGDEIGLYWDETNSRFNFSILKRA
ncbi:B3 domain-containing protein At2g33720-like [Alnus glutinosa]|uniref:B3 domain-containing protein At2g33720-like n=1 Tax=Alnus glutinosa TaxID=3517 RepID=UPI002D78AB55|nr:B3 domain-containing protein At2g33720-like [Alnus glutinosa]